MGVDKKARKKIKRKSRFGLKKHITSYKKDIVDSLYDKKLLEEILNKYLKKTGQENLNNAFRDYLEALTGNINKLLRKAREYISESYENGTERVVDKEGNTIKLDEQKDENAIKILTQQQQEYYKGLKKSQSKIVNNLIAEGLDKGHSTKQIASNIKSQVKKTTNASASRIARTEILNSHTMGQIDTMKQAEVEEYSIINSPDYIGKDGKKYPCKVCRKLQGPKGRENIYDLSRAGNKENPIIPRDSHPNCQCSLTISD